MLKNRMAQAVSTYMFLLFGVAIAFYLGGYQPLVFQSFDDEIGSDQTLGESFINSLGAIFTDPTLLAVLGITAVSSFVLGGSQFSAVFIIPVFMLTVFANMFILPSTFFFDPSLPFFIKAVIGLFMNMLLMLAIVNFVKGGGA